MATEAQCDACGELNPIDSAFCLNCGKYLGWHQNGPPTSGASAGAASGAPAGPPTGAPAGPATGAPTGPPRTGGASALPRRDAQGTPGASPPGGLRAAPAAGGCPACGQPLEPGRRFCSRCGYLLVPGGPTTAGPALSEPQGGSSGWWFWGDPAERAARRDYRRSLPPFYRWRRVLLSVLALVVVAVLVVALANDPVGWVKQRWYDVTGRTTALGDVNVRVLGATAPQYQASALTDNDARTAWATPWPASGEAAGTCGGPPGEGKVRLSWSRPVRIRGLRVQAGLDTHESGRDSQPLPRTLDVTYPDGRCVHVSLGPGPDPQTVKIDSTTPVRSVDVAVGSVFSSTAGRPDDVVALSELQVLVRPR